VAGADWLTRPERIQERKPGSHAGLPGNQAGRIEGHEELGRDILEWAMSESKQCDFGLFVFSRDRRWGNKPNGNVLLELGLFIGSLGPNRCFIIKAAATTVPSDLGGRILAEYDAKEFERAGASALENACARIRGAVKRRSNTLA